jgi:hypothetical protein
MLCREVPAVGYEKNHSKHVNALLLTEHGNFHVKSLSWFSTAPRLALGPNQLKI